MRAKRTGDEDRAEPGCIDLACSKYGHLGDEVKEGDDVGGVGEVVQAEVTR